MKQDNSEPNSFDESRKNPLNTINELRNDLSEEKKKLENQLSPEHIIKHYEHNIGLLKFYLELVLKVIATFFVFSGATWSFYLLNLKTINVSYARQIDSIPHVVIIVAVILFLGLTYLLYSLRSFEVETLYLKKMTSPAPEPRYSAYVATNICSFIAVFILELIL
jgi:hypothetical protein